MLKKGGQWFFVFACLMSSIILNGQVRLTRQLPFAPPGALPTLYNGGFAGEAGTSRIATYSQVRTFGGHVSGFSNRISYDNFIKKIRTGIGFTAGISRSFLDPLFYPSATMTSSVFGIAVSPKFSFKGKFTFAPFVDFSCVKSDGFLEKYNGASSNAGFLVNKSNAYMGFSARILSKQFSSPLQYHLVFYSLQGGYSFQRTPTSKFSFTPQLVMDYSHFESRQVRFIRYNLNLMFRNNKFIWGVSSGGWSFSDNGLIVGWQTVNFKIQLIQSFFKKSYSGSLAVRYVFNKKKIPVAF